MTSNALEFTREMYSITAAYVGSPHTDAELKDNIYGARKIHYGEPYTEGSAGFPNTPRYMEVSVTSGYLCGDFLRRMYLDDYILRSLDGGFTFPLWVDPSRLAKNFNLVLKSSTKDPYAGASQALSSIVFRSVDFKGVHVNPAAYKGGVTFEYRFLAREVDGAFADFLTPPIKKNKTGEYTVSYKEATAGFSVPGGIANTIVNDPDSWELKLDEDGPEPLADL